MILATLSSCLDVQRLLSDLGPVTLTCLHVLVGTVLSSPQTAYAYPSGDGFDALLGHWGELTICSGRFYR